MCSGDGSLHAGETLVRAAGIFMQVAVEARAEALVPAIPRAGNRRWHVHDEGVAMVLTPTEN